MTSLTETKRFGCDLFLAESFQDMRRATAKLEQDDEEFNRFKYIAWLKKHHVADTLQNRFRFLAFVSATKARQKI